MTCRCSHPSTAEAFLSFLAIFQVLWVRSCHSEWTKIFDDPVGPRYNVAPGTRPLTIHRLGDGTEQIMRLPWGYQPHNSKHFMVNAKLETIQKNGWPLKTGVSNESSSTGTIF
jgi:putative SOS response-associated peptidase YedK